MKPCAARSKPASTSSPTARPSKISYATYVKDRYHGVRRRQPPKRAGRSQSSFPLSSSGSRRDGDTPKYARPMCVGEVRSKGQGELQKDIANLKAAMATHGAKRGFMNAASPGVISLFLQNAHYPDRPAYLAALADAMAEEYRTIVDAGLNLATRLPPISRCRGHMLFTDLSDEEFVAVAEAHVEALNHALEGHRPRARGAHPHLLGQLRGAPCLRHRHGKGHADADEGARPLRALREPRTRAMPMNGPCSATARTRFPTTRCLCRASSTRRRTSSNIPTSWPNGSVASVAIFGAERVMAGSDCGFGTFAGFGAVDPEIAWAKLAALSEGARPRERALDGRTAPPACPA